MHQRTALPIVIGSYCCAAWALGWGAEVHRAVTRVALEQLPPDRPNWLAAPDTIEAIAFQANQPDRWRGWPSRTLKHENDPEHFLDAEQLEPYGLTLGSVPRLRREYIRVMAAAKAMHPDRMEPYDAGKDPAGTQEWPGFLLHAIAEHYAKLQAAFNQVRILERVNDPSRALELDQARQVAIYHLGALSHFVADAAQPLHTTRHYNGWVGENPAGYKWRDRFHAYIDEGWARTHRVDDAALRAVAQPAVVVRANDPWEDVLAYFERSHRLVAPLYVLERDGELDGSRGREMLMERLGDAVRMLKSLTWAAYESAAPTDEQVEKWLYYDDRGPRAASQPAAMHHGKTQTPATGAGVGTPVTCGSVIGTRSWHNAPRTAISAASRYVPGRSKSSVR